MIVLLICEYMIVVETNTVQKLKKGNTSKRIQYRPIADKLDRSDFGFDQDYYERMPLLLNALQDNSYDDPTAEMLVPQRKTIYLHRGHRMHVTAPTPRKSMRKSSPKPFLFEYRSPYPRPFQKALSFSDSWRESYHNAQKLKNLNDIVKYLEKTLNAKFGDLYVPSESQIAFSSVHLPTNYRYDKKTERDSKFDIYWNHHSDPLFSYKPDNPSDVNFLVDDSKLYFISGTKSFGRIPNDSVNKCKNHDCSRSFMNEKDPSSHDFDRINNRLYGDTDTKKNIDPNHIYITTSRPLVQFRRKTIQPPNRYLFQMKRSKYDMTKDSSRITIPKEKKPNMPRLILNLNVYPVEASKDNVVTTTTTTDNNKYYDNLETTSMSYENYPIVDNSNQLEINETSVEDFHVGSSGILPVSTPPTYPITTPSVPIFTTSESVTYVPSTIPPEIFKFSPEDAKVPDQYLNLRKSDTAKEITINTEGLQDEMSQKDNKYQNEYDILRKSDVYEVTTNVYDHSQSENDKDEAQEEKAETLIVKLKNSIASTTEENQTDATELPTQETYVPQLNGHYRHMKYRNLSALLKESSDRYKKRLQNLTIRKPTYVPMIPEKQNGTDVL